MSTFMQQFKEKKIIAKRSKKYLEEALYKRLFNGGSSEVTVRQNLNQFIKSRKRVYKWEVGHTLKELRHRGRFSPALKLSETMEERGMMKTVGDQAIHLDLVAKTRGIAAAENYFTGLKESLKNHFTYSALLNCYCKEKMTEKAEALLEKMKELKFEMTSVPYNSLMTLYEKTGCPERIPSIIQEMKANNIMPDSYTYNIWMRALASANDIYGVERVVDEMKRDGRVEGDWTFYSNLASIYVNANSFDKAEKALKELEKKSTFKDLSAYQFLITLYGKTGNLSEVYRVWRSLRLAFRETANISYLNMIQVLVNLKDLPGAEKCFREWESGCSTYDIRVANILIRAYAKEGNFEKAEETKERARRRGAKPNAKTCEIFLDYYFKNGEIKSAVNCVDNAIKIGKGDGGKWVPSLEATRKIMKYFEENKDVDGAEIFWGILEKGVDKMGAELFEALLRTYAEAGRKSPTLKRRMKMANVELGENYTKLLDEVCAVE